MTLTTRETYVNDIPVTVKNYTSSGRKRETETRRLAAELDRGAEHVRKVTNAPAGVDVWIDPPSEGMTNTPTPDGYSARSINHFERGTVCVTYEVDE